MTDLSLALAQDLSRLEVRPQVDEPHLAPGALDLADPAVRPAASFALRSAYSRRSFASASSSSSALRLRLGEHRVQQRLGLGFLIRAELESVLQLEDVYRPG
jgi:hypothetical protein